MTATTAGTFNLPVKQGFGHSSNPNAIPPNSPTMIRRNKETAVKRVDSLSISSSSRWLKHGLARPPTHLPLMRNGERAAQRLSGRTGSRSSPRQFTPVELGALAGSRLLNLSCPTSGARRSSAPSSSASRTARTSSSPAQLVRHRFPSSEFLVLNRQRQAWGNRFF